MESHELEIVLWFLDQQWILEEHNQTEHLRRDPRKGRGEWEGEWISRHYQTHPGALVAGARVLQGPSPCCNPASDCTAGRVAAKWPILKSLCQMPSQGTWCRPTYEGTMVDGRDSGHRAEQEASPRSPVFLKIRQCLINFCSQRLARSYFQGMPYFYMKKTTVHICY